MEQPTVSIVVVNFNGKHHLEACFTSLAIQSYPADKTEIILIDNNSHDGSREFMTEHFPKVKLVLNQDNVGFAAAVNQGAKLATGEYLALINNDAYADPHWLEAMVTTLTEHRAHDVVCVAAKILDWYGKNIDFVGGGTNFYGHADQFFHKLPVGTIDPPRHEVLFACGGAMLVDRQIFLEIGGFDADYFAYFEDVDFGWRLCLFGYRVLYEPKAFIYHRLHGTSKTMYQHQVAMLGERNTLLTIIKNYDDENLNQILAPALLLMMKRSSLFAGGFVRRKEYDLRQRDPLATDTTITVPKIALSPLMAVNDIIRDFPKVWGKRQYVQVHRKRTDAEIFKLFGKIMSTNFVDQPYLELHHTLSKAFKLDEVFAGQRQNRILIISTDPLQKNLSGVGIRVLATAQELAKIANVIVAAPEQVEVELDDVQFAVFKRGDQEAIQILATQSDIVIIHGFTLHHYPILLQLNRMLVVDLYDPSILSNLELHIQHPEYVADHAMKFDQKVFQNLLLYGDFFVCASERQRDLWLGALTMLGRITPKTYQADPSLRSLVDVAPFGIDAVPPVATKAVLKGVIPGINPTDYVVLWGGGIWDWLDPLTVIRAMQIVAQERFDVKLFFMGKGHPNPHDVPEMTMANKAVALAQELGLYNTHVFFNDQWVPYTERANYLLEADIGVNAHFDHIETHFAFRTRLLDYIWANVPMVVTAGDTLADMVQAKQLGSVVEIGNSEHFAQAILAMVEHQSPREQYKPAFEAVRSAFLWQNTLQPLIEFCKHPVYAQDKRTPTTEIEIDKQEVIAGMQHQMDEMYTTILQKNEHIANLETMIKQLESGKVMRALQRIQRFK